MWEFIIKLGLVAVSILAMMTMGLIFYVLIASVNYSKAHDCAPLADNCVPLHIEVDK